MSFLILSLLYISVPLSLCDPNVPLLHSDVTVDPICSYAVTPTSS
nr:MAG TPA: hypothetical protein [Crassvirales sp.]